jgi:hypothetical protein
MGDTLLHLGVTGRVHGRYYHPSWGGPQAQSPLTAGQRRMGGKCRAQIHADDAEAQARRVVEGDLLQDSLHTCPDAVYAFAP